MGNRLFVIGLIIVVFALPVSAQYLDRAALEDILGQGSQGVALGELLLDERFDSRNAWEFYESDTANAFVRNGVYYMDRVETETTMWAQNTTTHDDVVMAVDIRQLSSTDDNAFGVMCRANPENNAQGYHLRISGDGFAAIGVNAGEGLNLIAGWTPTVAINQGQQLNRIVAVCVGDYIALYVNGALALQVNDSTFSEGVAGFSIANYVEGSNVEVEFDNLEIYSASSGNVAENRAGNGIRIVPRGDGATNANQDGADSDEEETRVPIDFITANSGLAIANGALSGNSADVRLGDVVATANFDDETMNAWEIVNYKEETVLFTTKVIGGRYVAYAEGTNAGSNNASIDLQNVHEDVVITATTEQLSSEANNGYGVVCRADLSNNGDGYYLRISGDGFYSVSVVEGGEFTFLQEWTATPSINTGQANNELVAVCVEDYLAFYINGVFMGEYRDTTFTRGTTGIIIVSYVENEPIEIAFDDIVVIEATR